jgi:uncharacterized membrane protein
VEALLLFIVAAMFGLSAWAWARVPDRIPVHWNLQGEPDGYGGKLVGLIVLPLTMVGVYLLTLVAPFADPRRGNYPNFKKAYNAIRIVLMLFFATIHIAAIAAALGHRINMTAAIMPGLGVMFVILGNFMSKIRPNWFVGVRTPWTLSSRLSWDKTHRLAGWLFMLMAALFFVVAAVPTTTAYIAMFTIDVICLAVIIAYSYVVYRGDPHREAHENKKADSA